MEHAAAFAGSIPANYERYLGPFLFEPYALDMVDRLQDRKYPHILELACGTGRVTAHLVRSVQYDSLTATDLNPDMIEVAKRVTSEPGIKWKVADALDLPFNDNVFDLIVCQFGVMFFPDKAKGMQEAFRVLKPGGRFLFNTWDRVENNPAIHTGRQVIESYFESDPPQFYNVPFSMFDPGELEQLMVGAGFADVTVSRVSKAGQSKNAAGLAKGMIQGNPIYLSIIEKDPALIEPIENSVAARLAKEFGDDPLKSPLTAWVCDAHKPL